MKLSSGKNEKNSKNAIWLYAVILFTSAFIVLLLTAYSQIKFNRNLNDYKSQLYSEENAKNNISTSLGTALSENKRLMEELKSVKQEVEDSKIKIEDGNAALKKQQQKANSTINVYDLLVKAQMEYDKGNILGCADILYSKLDSKLLGKSGADLYESLIEKVYGKAAALLYTQGYNEYLKREYDEAAKNLKLSLDYSPNEYFSDDCLYFIAYSKYRQNNNKEAKEYMERLINDYPNSNYKKEAVDLIKEMSF